MADGFGSAAYAGDAFGSVGLCAGALSIFFGKRERGGEFCTSVCHLDEHEVNCVRKQTHPGHLSVKESMKHMFIRQSGMPCDAIQERLQHPFAPSNQGRVLLRFGLLDGIITNSVL